jgi:tight adherence protein B
MDPTLISIVIGVVVVALFGGAGLALLKTPATLAERRLDELNAGRRANTKTEADSGNILRPPALDLGEKRDFFKKLFSVDGLERLYEQADVGLPFSRFVIIALGLGVSGAAAGFFLKVPPLLLPLCAAFLGALPFFWLVRRKRKRIKNFVAQMPDAMELVGRALRAGHGLASGLSVVAEEMPRPIADEFGRVYEEQNLGIPIEEALRCLAERVPAMDVRFFVTAVVIQRATGGDLAEVLDKIGRIIRERFQILGQVQALTAEGRLSGAVLLALPPGLLAFCYWLNPSYISLLWTTPIGEKMLAGTAVLQLLGAIAIKKIITIKV